MRDGGNRRAMHENLSRAREEYAARPTNEKGVVLATVPNEFTLEHTARRAEARDGAIIAIPNHEHASAHWKSSKEQEQAAMWDGGTRRTMHSDLSKARETYEARANEYGVIVPTQPQAFSLDCTAHRATLRGSPIATIDRDNAPVSSGIHESGFYIS